MKPTLTVLVGPPGSGKTTAAMECVQAGFQRISQDEQGKDGHWNYFLDTLELGLPIVLDRMNFSKEQRTRYIEAAEAKGYTTQIIVFCTPQDICLERCTSREGHPTIKTETDARRAIHYFFTHYEKPDNTEASEGVVFRYHEIQKEDAIICDLDGTLCNLDHRLHYVRGPKKKNWDAFYHRLDEDAPNEWCKKLVTSMWTQTSCSLVFCSGRPDTYRNQTIDWIGTMCELYSYELYMRESNDYRPDYVVKEQILDFELLPRYNILFCIDDRKQVVDMWRRRGLTCLQCAEGDF